MTPRRALDAIEGMLDTIDHLFPGFHTACDRADLTEARGALDDLARRLERTLAADEATLEDDHG
jgi:hypothetical protein